MVGRIANDDVSAKGMDREGPRYQNGSSIFYFTVHKRNISYFPAYRYEKIGKVPIFARQMVEG